MRHLRNFLKGFVLTGLVAAVSLVACFLLGAGYDVLLNTIGRPASTYLVIFLGACLVGGLIGLAASIETRD